MQDTQALSKAELIEKLEEISVDYKATLALTKKIKKFQPSDNYERTVKVPPFPCDFMDEDYFGAEGEDRNAVDKAFADDSKALKAERSRIKELQYKQHALARKGDVAHIAEKYDCAKKPKAPKKPKESKPTEPEKHDRTKARSRYEQMLVKAQEEQISKKPGRLTIGCGVVAVIVLFSGGLFDGFLSFIINALILLACAVGISFDYRLKVMDKEARKEALEREAKAGLARIEEEEKKYEQDMKAYQEALVASEQAHQEAMSTYEQRMAAYQEALVVYEQNKATFLQEYTKWKDLYLAHLEEEEKITKQLVADRIAGQEKLCTEELTPAIALLATHSDLLVEDYMPYTDDLISFLKSGRADNLKEALNRLEEKLYREQQLELQREQERQRQWEEEQRREDEERHHREQMELRERQEWQRREDEDRRQRDEERRYQQQREDEERYRREEDRRRKEAEDDARRRDREAADRAKREAQNRCLHCANRRTCTMKVNAPQNCAAFRP